MAQSGTTWKKTTASTRDDQHLTDVADRSEPLSHERAAGQRGSADDLIVGVGQRDWKWVGCEHRTA